MLGLNLFKDRSLAKAPSGRPIGGFQFGADTVKLNVVDADAKQKELEIKIDDIVKKINVDFEVLADREKDDLLFVKSEIGENKKNEGTDRFAAIIEQYELLLEDEKKDGGKTEELFQKLEKVNADFEELKADIETWKVDKKERDEFLTKQEKSWEDIMVEADDKVKVIAVSREYFRLKNPDLVLKKNFDFNLRDKIEHYVGQSEEHVDPFHKDERKMFSKVLAASKMINTKSFSKTCVVIEGITYMVDTVAFEAARSENKIRLEGESETDEEKIERTKYSRSGAEITLQRVKDFDELNADTEKEGDKLFLEKTRELWKEFAVHGFWKNGELNKNTDLDGKCCLELLRLAGFSKEAIGKNLEYIKQGKKKEGYINIDTGNKEGVVVEDFNVGKTAFIDHHDPEKSKSNSSAAMHVYQMLVDLGLLEKNEARDRMVEFVTMVDSGEYPEIEKNYFQNSHRTMIGLARFAKPAALIRFFEKDKNPDPLRELSDEELRLYGFITKTKNRSEEQKNIADTSLEKLKKMEKDGFIVESEKYGRILVNIEDETNIGGNRNLPGGYLAARAYGCPGYINWRPEENWFIISANVPIEGEFTQGLKVREVMVVKDGEPEDILRVTLDEILEKMTDGKLKPGGKLRDFLDNNLSVFKDELSEELKSIRSGTKEEQRQKLEEFKKKMIEQKKGMAEIQKKLLGEVEKNPNASVEEYLKLIQDSFDELNLSNDQRAAFKKSLESYVETHQAIDRNTRDCIDSNTGKVDGLKLYEKLFDRKPEGKVEVILRPAMIYVRIENLDDYALACTGGAADSVTDKMREKAINSGGRVLRSCKIADLKDVVALEKATDGRFSNGVNDEVLKHEEQHVLNSIIQHGYDAELEKINKKKIVDKEYVDNVVIENRIKDEISAYFKEGRSPEYIRETLLKSDTIYEYGFNYKGGDVKKAEFSQEYVDLVENGISAYAYLLRIGYSAEDVQGLLFVEPLSKWMKVAERITGKKVVKTEKEKTKREDEINKLVQEVNKARKEYLEVDYKKKKAWNRVGNFFGNIGKDDRKRGFENDQDVAFYRAHYDNNLLKLQELLVNDARERGASDEELAKLYVEFRTEQRITLESEHDQVKIEQQDGKVMAFVSKKAQEITEEYKKMPTWKKLAVGATFAGAALTAGQIGAGAVAAVATAATARRLVMGMITGVGVTVGLEKRGQMKDRKNIEKEEKEFLEKLANMNDKDKYALLSDNIKNIAIKDEENTINKIKNQDMRQITAGVAVGTFLASGLAGQLAKWGIGKGSDIYHGLLGGQSESGMGGWSTNAYEHGHSLGAETNNGGWSTNAFENSQKSGIENASPHEVDKALEIKKGSSIEGTLIKYIKESHPNIKNPGAAAHRMWLDYMDDNKEKIIEKVGSSEYQKMLKDGMVNVRPGTEIVIDPNFGRIVDIEGKMSHLHVNNHVGGGHFNGGKVEYADMRPTPQPEAPVVGEDFSGDAEQIKVENQADIQNSDAHANDLKAEIAPQAEVVHSGSNEVLVSNYRANPNAFTSQIGNTENVAKMADNVDRLNVDLLKTNKVLYKLVTENQYIMEHPEDISRNSSIIRDEIFGKGPRALRAFREVSSLKVSDALNSDEILDKAPKRIIKGVMKTVPAKDGDSLHKWIVRVAVNVREIGKQ